MDSIANGWKVDVFDEDFVNQMILECADRFAFIHCQEERYLEVLRAITNDFETSQNLDVLQFCKIVDSLKFELLPSQWTASLPYLSNFWHRLRDSSACTSTCKG